MLSTVSLLLATSLVLALPGCISARRAVVAEALAEAGQQEQGTKVAWVEGNGTAKELAFLADPEGQWATTATASSTYADVHGVDDFSPMQATGAPDAHKFAADERSWRPEKENLGYEWLELSYEIAVHARSVRIREVHGCGSVVMVQLKDTEGRYHVKWKGRDKVHFVITWLVLDFPETDYLVDGVKVTLDTTLVGHWKHFDAVQLVGSP